MIKGYLLLIKEAEGDTRSDPAHFISGDDGNASYKARESAYQRTSHWKLPVDTKLLGSRGGLG